MNLQEQKNIYLNGRERMDSKLQNQLQSNNIELANNPAFPKTDSNGNPINFLELIAYKRFNEVVQKIKRYTNIQNATNLGEITSTLMRSVNNVTTAEKPNIPNLEKLSIKLVVEEMEIPERAFNYDVKIVPVGSISGDGFQMEGQEQNEQEIQNQFGEQAQEENMTASELFEMEKHKRRFINMLIQGSSKKGHYMFELVRGKLNELNPELANEYGKMMSVNDMLYWILPDQTIKQMASEPSNMAGKEEIQDDEDSTTLKVRGINFPVLLHELIKAIMEVFGTQGLPDDPQSSQMIIDSVDSLENETMDLRFGVPVWDLFVSSYPNMVFEDGNKYLQHYLFSRFCALDVEEFFRVSKLIMSQDKRGTQYMEKMTNEIIKDLQRQDYQNQFGNDDEGYSFDDIVGYRKGGSVEKGYNVFNYTDNVYASDEVFKTKKLANNFIKEFRNRFSNQGYYRDNQMNKIAIEDIDLLAIPSDFNPFKKFTKGGFAYVDLFEDYENIPANVQAILNDYELEDSDYNTLNDLQNELAEVGYTFEFGLDAEPFALRPIGVEVNELQGYEDYEKDNFEDGGEAEFDIYDYDKKMALINLDEIYEYAIKIDRMINEDADLEEWVKMKLTRIEQSISDVKHSLEGWEKYKNGGEIPKKQLLHIAKYSKELIKMIQGGSKLMSWQEDKLAISSASIDDIYHHLDYKMGNRAEDLEIENKDENFFRRGGKTTKKYVVKGNVYDGGEIWKETFDNLDEAISLATEIENGWTDDGTYYLVTIYNETGKKVAEISTDKYFHRLTDNKLFRKIDFDADTKKERQAENEKLKAYKFNLQVRIASYPDNLTIYDKTFDSIFDVMDKMNTYYEEDYYALINDETLDYWEDKMYEIDELRNYIKGKYGWSFIKEGNLWIAKHYGENYIVRIKNGKLESNDSAVTKGALKQIAELEAQKKYSEKPKHNKSLSDMKKIWDGLSDNYKERENIVFLIGYSGGQLRAVVPSKFNDFPKSFQIRIMNAYFGQTEEQKEKIINKQRKEHEKLVKKYPKLRNLYGKKFVDGGDVEGWMQSALYQLQAEEDNDNLQISFVKNNEFTCQDDDANEYRVFKNEDVAEEMAVEEVREDIEYQPENFSRDFLMDFVDVDDFLVLDIENANYDYVKDIEDESNDKYANRLIAELVEYGLISENEALTTDPTELSDEFSQDYIDLLTSEQIGDDNGVQYFIDNFGEDEFFKIVIDNNLIDFENASQDAVNMDGIAHFLARYDGETIYLDNNVVAYRTN